MTADGTTAREEAGDWRPVLEQAGLGDLERVFAYAGGDDLAKPGLGHRRRTKLELVDSAGQRRALYLKRYGDEPWSWRLRRWWTYGPRMSPAKVEATNIHAAAEAGIATMRAVAFGQAPGAFQAGRSYIIVTSVPGDALSRTLNDFLYRHANDGAAGELALRLGSLAGRMHGAGLAHRDFYTAHVFLDERGATFELYLIDLARMFRPSRWRRRRYQVKDIAQLKFSLPGEFVVAHWRAFMAEYARQAGLREDMLDGFERAVDRKVAWMLARSGRNRTK